MGGEEEVSPEVAGMGLRTWDRGVSLQNFLISTEILCCCCCFSFWLHHRACEILAAQSGTEPGPTAVKARCPNHWTARKFPLSLFSVILIHFLF